MHQIYQMYYQKCIHIKSDIHIAVMQIKSTQQEPGLPSPAMLLFNHPIRSIMPISTDHQLIQIMIMGIMKH